MLLPAALVLGVAAGTITTVAGFGGGMVLTLALAALLGPGPALVVAAPALAVGHAHRCWVYRREIDSVLARRFALAAAPGAVIGALLVAWVPESLLDLALVLAVILAVVQACGWIPRELGRRALAPGAFGVGFLAGSCGAGGVLLAPTLMSAGLAGRRFVATASVGALVIQLVRLATYGAAGLVGGQQLPLMLVAGVGLIAGNALGRRAALRLDEARTTLCTRAVLVIAIALAAYGALA